MEKFYVGSECEWGRACQKEIYLRRRDVQKISSLFLVPVEHCMLTQGNIHDFADRCLDGEGIMQKLAATDGRFW